MCLEKKGKYGDLNKNDKDYLYCFIEIIKYEVYWRLVNSN